MRIWIDLANSPHPLLFTPVGRRLEGLGHTVLVTARDNAQTVDIARGRWGAVEVIGRASPKGRAAKAAAMRQRVCALVAWGRSERPDVALSHNSYGQLLAARTLGLPAVTAMDFEYQPLNHLAFRLAHEILMPEALRGSAVRRQGATAEKARFYPGFKEEIYLGDFDPDPHILERLGIERGPGTAVVVARTPPSRAIYHPFANPLFNEALVTIGSQRHVHCVVLVRHPEQRRALAALELSNVVLPERAVDSRSLMRAADLVVGAGGTMTREAALLRVPTFSVFAGKSPAVDRSLERQGLLRYLKAASDILPIRPRSSAAAEPSALRERGERLVRQFVDAATRARSDSVRAAASLPGQSLG